MDNIFWGSAKSWLMHSKLIDQSTKSNYSRHGGSQIIEGEKSKTSEITKKGDRDRQRKTVEMSKQMTRNRNRVLFLFYFGIKRIN